MAREIGSSRLEKTPSVKFTRQNVADIPGVWMIGVKLGQKNWKDNVIFEFALEEADERLPFLLSTGEKGVYAEAEVGPGSKVAVWGTIKDGVPNQLADKLGQTVKDDRVKITFTGKVLNPDTGRSYNNFKVEVL